MTNYEKKRKKAKKEADKLFQIYGLNKEPLCRLCGKPATCVHHIIPKGRSNAVRYEIMNMASLCQGCHHLWHATQDVRLYERMRPKNYKQLEAKSRQEVRTNLSFYLEAIDKLR